MRRVFGDTSTNPPKDLGMDQTPPFWQYQDFESSYTGNPSLTENFSLKCVVLLTFSNQLGMTLDFNSQILFY